MRAASTERGYASSSHFGPHARAADSGDFNNAAGIVYQDGKPVAKFTAPVVNAVEEKQVVVATGRVRIDSIDPPGGTVEADRVWWFIERKKVLAEGAVVVRYRKSGQP